MNTLRSRKESSPFESYPPKLAALVHRCPVCARDHEVSAARAQFAYGRQLACSPDCEATRRRRSRAAFRVSSTRLFRNTSGDSTASLAWPAVRNPILHKLMTSTGQPAAVAIKPLQAASAERSGYQQRSTRCVASADEHKAVISVTVEASDVLCVRRGIFQAGGASIGILKTAPVPHSSRVRVFIGMKPQALESIMTAIMRSVTACEFGRVVRM